MANRCVVPRLPTSGICSPRERPTCRRRSGAPTALLWSHVRGRTGKTKVKMSGPLLGHPASTQADTEFFNLKSINVQKTSVPVQKFKPGSGKVANVKSKAKASQGAAWSMNLNEVERYLCQETIRKAPDWLIKTHDLFRMRASIAEVMTNMDVKKQFGQRLFSVFNSAAKVAWLVLRLQHLH